MYLPYRIVLRATKRCFVLVTVRRCYINLNKRITILNFCNFPSLMQDQKAPGRNYFRSDRNDSKRNATYRWMRFSKRITRDLSRETYVFALRRPNRSFCAWIARATVTVPAATFASDKDGRRARLTDVWWPSVASSPDCRDRGDHNICVVNASLTPFGRHSLRRCAFRSKHTGHDAAVRHRSKRARRVNCAALFVHFFCSVRLLFARSPYGDPSKMSAPVRCKYTRNVFTRPRAYCK